MDLSSVFSTDHTALRLQFYALIVLGVIALILTVAAIVRLCLRHGKIKRCKASGKNAPGGVSKLLTVVLCIAAVISLAVTGLCGYILYGAMQEPVEPQVPTTEATVPTTQATIPPTTEATQPTTEPTTVPTEPEVVFAPHHTANSDPANWDITWEIISGDEIVQNYTREEPITFGEAEEYTTLEGVTTFRGNNFRSDPTYGTANLANETVSYLWSAYNGALDGWPGCGWTGQPQIIKWDDETKAIMNLYDSAKEKEDLVEVIYGTLDGYIYFFDLEDGTRTRDPIYVGMVMKGSGTLDPRGFPLLYVGSGTVLNGVKPRMYIISLIDSTILDESGANDSWAPRYWSGFDSAPLVDAETDTLIWPGENGLLYTIKLNTNYDAAAGTISVDPGTPVMVRYSTDRSNNETYWVGMEDSVCMVENFLYVADNSGMVFCVDINTMELIWAQDIKDDTNASPVFEWGEDGNGYIYIAPSLHWTANGSWGEISLYKLDAQTGEIVWEVPYECGTIEDLSGGVQSTPVIGRVGSDLEGLVVFSISYTPNMSTGILVALDTETGETVWEKEMGSYAWSSPVAVYNKDNKGYIIMPTFEGTLLLIDGATGETVDAVDLGSHTEASAVVYESTVVIGTRGCTIYGLELS